MSMISSQCDKLRETADEIQRIKNNNADWLWRDAITLADAAGQMRDAADFILELRDGLQRANAENDKLRERIHELEMEGSDHFYRTAYAEDANRTLEAENARLRELLLDVADVLGKNEKLRELADRLRMAASDGAGNACEVLDENAKLRKLLLDAWNDAMQVDSFRDYVHDDGEIYNEDELPQYQERMRELGVEVNGWEQ